MEASITCRSASSSCLRRALRSLRRADFIDFWLVSVFMDFLFQVFRVSGFAVFRKSGPIPGQVRERNNQQAERQVWGMKNPPWSRFGPVTLNQVVQVGRRMRL